MFTSQNYGQQGFAGKSVTTVELLSACVADRENSAAWSAFLGHILPKLKYFVRGTLCRAGYASLPVGSFFRIAGEEEEEDFVQATIVRLVENDFVLLKRFKGKTENDLLAYLAIISRSVVRDCWRRNHALKRGRLTRSELMKADSASIGTCGVSDRGAAEFQVLVREVVALARQALNPANGFSARDRLIFKLHFLDGLSAAQIAESSDISLTKPGIEKVIWRVVNWTRKMVGAGSAKPCARSPHPTR